MTLSVSVRQAVGPQDAARRDTQGLRDGFVIEALFRPGAVNLTYSHLDRMIVGGVVPTTDTLVVDSVPETGTERFLDRREVAVVNIGGAGTVSVGGKDYALGFQEALYVGMGEGALGFASDALGSLFDGGAFNYSVGGDATATIFDFGGRRAGVDVTKAQRDAALASYEGTIQTAFREVADALAVQGTIAERVRAAGANTSAAADTAMLADARYKGGVDSFLASLDAQRSLYAARRSEIGTQLLLIQTRIALFRALGGDSQAAP